MTCLYIITRHSSKIYIISEILPANLIITPNKNPQGISVILLFWTFFSFQRREHNCNFSHWTCLADCLYQLRNGLRDVQWAGRFDIISHSPLFIIDGGHNPRVTAEERNRDSKLLKSRIYFPDSIHHPAFPSPVLKAGKKYDHTTVFTFTTL